MEPTNANDVLRTADYEAAPENEGVPSFPVCQATGTLGRAEDAPQWDESSEAQLPPPPAVPGYEIEGVLGRGGMGVVYKARHLALKRTVAFKMILAGGHATESERLRFKTETEAVARLQHPGIVQVYEVGEHQNLPFCALEFVEGGSLSQKLGGQPFPPRGAARLVEALAQAMHMAHSCNVVHRDLKPANVLLTADGAPKITDFGLAKHLDADSGGTLAGAVMGTPSYMAPEQASGRAHEAGPAADTYALGAILYECLTGRPPFRGTTALETLDQVLTREPVPPARLQPGVSRDLETICLKCLCKEPERRYASAAELADELGRVLRGEPVLARPVGKLERGWRWCRRNPTLAATLAATVLFLVIGTALACWFAVAAGWQANEALRVNGELDRQKAELDRTNDELAGKAIELSRERDRLEATLVRTWLAPLSQHAGPLTEPEVAALMQVADHRGQSLAQRFIHEGLTDAALTPRFAARAQYAWQAALGLDLRRRNEAERWLLAELQSEQRAGRREALALAAAGLGGLSRDTAARAAAILTQAMSRTTDPNTLQSLAGGLSAIVARLEPKDAATAIAALNQALSKTADTETIRFLARELSALAARLEPKHAAEAIISAVTQVLSKTDDSITLHSLNQGLLAVGPRLEPKDAAEAHTRFIQTITERTEPRSLESRLEMERVLSALAARLEPSQAAEAATIITKAMNKTTEPNALKSLAKCLSGVASRLEPEQTAAMCSQAATTLTQAMSKTTEPDALASLAQGLSAVAGRLDPNQAVEVCGQAAATLTQAMSKTTRPIDMWLLAQRLSAVAAPLKPKQAAELCGQAATLLTQAMNKTTEPSALQVLAQGLSAVAAPLKPKQAAELCGQAATLLTQTMNKTTEPNALQALAQGLSAVAARLEPKQAAELCGQATSLFIGAMNKSIEPNALQALAQGLSEVAARLEPKQAIEVCGQAATLLTRAMNKTTEPNALQALAQGLSAVAGRLEPKQAAEAAAKLSQAMTKTTEPNAFMSLTHVLSEVAARLESKQAAAAATTLTQAVTKTTDPDVLGLLVLGLSELANRLELEQLLAVRGQATTTYIYALTKTTRPNVLWYLADGLELMAGHLEPKQVAEAAATLTHALSITTDPNGLQSLAAGMKALVAGLPAQMLVDLLKHPLCVGEVRRLVLDELSRHYADQWDFVRHAEEQKLDLDLFCPPPPQE